MDQLLFAAIAAILLSTTSAFNCPNTCVCYQTQNNQQAANCTDLEALHKHLIRQKNPHLDSLTLKDSSITKINGQLDRLTDLKILNLSGNNIKSVKRLPKHLVKLDLSKNILNSIDALELPSSLEELYLEGNHLEVLPLSLNRLKHLNKLHLRDNPLSCSCETLKIRDWLLRSSITTDIITCSIEYRDAVPWTEIKSIESCPKSTKEHDFDDFMQGDDPFAGDVFQGSGSKSDDLDDEYDDDVFISVSTAAPKKVEVTPKHEDEYDGSGGGSDFNFDDGVSMDTSEFPVSETTLSNTDSGEISHITEKTLMETSTPEDDTEDDGSGSGGGALIHFPDDEDMPFFPSESPNTEEPSFTSSKSTFGDFSNLFNWFGGSDDNKEEEIPEMTSQQQEVLTSEAPVFVDLEPVVEPEIIKQEAPKQETTFVNQPKPSDTTKEEINVGNVQSAKDGDNSTTYACLGVLSFLLLVLVLFVIFKKRKTDKRRKRQQRKDAENPGTEMRDINKKLIESNDVKPKTNGNFETVPLVSNGDKKNQSGPRIIPATVHNNGDSKIEPMVSKPVNKPQVQSQSQTNGKSLEKILDPKMDQPVKKAEVPAVHGQPAPVTNKDQDEPIQTDQTPIYPNDCKVRIKLKENPDSVPKTPVLVTRTRSNAGDIILTPVNNGLSTLT